MDQSQVTATASAGTGIPWLWTMGLLGIYVLFTYLIGFVLATVMYILAMRFLGTRRMGGKVGLVDLAVGAGLGVGVAIVGYLFRIPFPAGLFLQSLRF